MFSHTKVFLGSKASLMPSKIKTRSASIIENTKNALKPNQGAWRFCFACIVSSPSDGYDAGKPKPKKSSAANDPIDPVRINGIKVSVATIALGNKCLKIIEPVDTPRAFAAITYSKFLALKNSARTTPTNAVQLNKVINSINIKKSILKKADKIIIT